MGQPNPPGDLPLIEGLGSEWNEFVSAFPEDKRAELGPRLKERITAQTSQYEPLKQWEEFQKSGITPEHASTALNLFSIIENDPKQIYDTLGNYLGLTKAETKEAIKEIKEIQEDNPNDPRIATMQQQIDTMTQILLSQRQMTAQEQLVAEQEATLKQEIDGIKQKYGNDVPEEEIVMRMLHKDMSAEDAYQEYSNMVSEIRKRRPAPMIMGSGGVVPNRTIDPTKLDSKQTKDLVAQMFDHANAERKA